MKVRQKEKKITVKFFLNQLVEPMTGENEQRYYPLYIQITYNRKNMQLKSMYGEYYEDLNEVKPGLMEFEERVLRNIITYETGQTFTEGDYDLKGLKRKYEVYATAIQEALEQYLKPRLRLAILKTNHELTTVLHFNQLNATVGRLYKAAQLLFPGFDNGLTVSLKEDLAAYEQYRKLYKMPSFQYDFPTLMDWVDGAYRKELEGKLKAVYKQTPTVPKKVLALVGQAVIEKLKQLGE